MKDYTQIMQKKKSKLLSDEARYERRVEALTLVENNLCLQELIADINDCQTNRFREFARAIANYNRSEHGIHQTEDELIDVLVEDVFEDNEHQGELWMNGISINMRQFHNEENRSRFQALSINEILEYAAILF